MLLDALPGDTEANKTHNTMAKIEVLVQVKTRQGTLSQFISCMYWISVGNSQSKPK